MIFYVLMDVVLIVLMVMFFVTQLITPALNKRALFPLFRKQGKLEKQEAELNQLAVEKQLEKQLEKKSNTLKKGS